MPNPTVPAAATGLPSLLENYASWLFYERRRVLLELYPDLPPAQAEARLMVNAGWLWHMGSQQGQPWGNEAPSTRAEAVLDLVGVDWRQGQRDAGPCVPSVPPEARSTKPLDQDPL